MFSVRFITPTRIANAGNIVGDYVTVALTVVGIIFSIITMTKKQRRRDCDSFIHTVLIIFIFWIIAIILLFTGQISFAP